MENKNVTVAVFESDQYALRCVFSHMTRKILEVVPVTMGDYFRIAEKYDRLDGDGTRDWFVGSATIRGHSIATYAYDVPFVSNNQEGISQMLEAYYGREAVYVSINMGTGALSYIRPSRNMQLVRVLDAHRIQDGSDIPY